MIFTINNEYQGKTVLVFLRSVLKISSNALAALKRDEKGIMINGRHVTVRYMLQAGDLLEINEKDSIEDTNEYLLPIELPINVLFENDDIILVDKPPYMPTHPSHNHTDDTLANALAYKYRDVPFVFRPIGRLDRNTSGISLVAKHSIAASYLFYAKQKNLIQKKYIAILQGNLDVDNEWHTIETYMKRQEESIIVRCVSNEQDEDAFNAITQYKVLFSNNNISIVEAIPITGRTHQLRVHFSHIGHPILGDDVYGEPSIHIGRHALHASMLSIPLPYNCDRLDTVSQIPEDMKNAIRQNVSAEQYDICQKVLNNQGLGKI